MDDTILLWNAHTGQRKAILKGHTGNVYSVAFSPDGGTLASGSGDATIRLWDVVPATSCDKCLFRSIFTMVARWPAEVRMMGRFGYGMPIPDNGRYLKDIWRVSILWRIHQMAASWPVGVVTLQFDCGMWLQNNTRQYLKDIRMNSVAFSPDGGTLASGSGDATIRLCVGTGQHKTTLEGHTDRVHFVAFSPDGSNLASASNDDSLMGYVAVYYTSTSFSRL